MLLSLHITVKVITLGIAVLNLCLLLPLKEVTIFYLAKVFHKWNINSSVCVYVSVYLYKLLIEILVWSAMWADCFIFLFNQLWTVSGTEVIFAWNSLWWQIAVGLVLWVLLCSPQSCFSYVFSIWAVSAGASPFATCPGAVSDYAI